MTDDELAPCPYCGGKVTNDKYSFTSTGNGILCDVYCTEKHCNYKAHNRHHAEISAAMAYYHEHKDRRCENCGWRNETQFCNNWNMPADNNFYCADWTEAKK